MSRFIILFLFSISVLNQNFADGIEFFTGTWDQILEEASAQNKMIFVDAYAVWCGPCKKMTKNVFPKDEVGSYYNEHFINVKLDMEKGEGRKFQKKYPVKAFPTFMYISPDGELVLSVTGYRQPADFVEIGRKATERYDPSAGLAKKYKDGDRDFETVHGYVKGLNANGKSSLAISNEYLRGQKDLSTPKNLEFIFDAATESDSRIFDYLIEHREKINKLKSKSEVDVKIKTACEATVAKGIEYEMEELITEAQSKMTKHLPNESKEFIGKTNLAYAASGKNEKLFIKSAKSYLNSGSNKNGVKSTEIITFAIKDFDKNPNVLSFAEKIAKKASSSYGTTELLLNHAKILQLQGNSQKALQIVEKIISNTTDKRGPTRDILQFKQELENS